MVLTHFDLFPLALILSPVGLAHLERNTKAARMANQLQQKPTTRAFVSVSSHSHSRGNKELERQNIIFCDMFMR